MSRKRLRRTDFIVQEHDTVETPFGPAMKISIRRDDGAVISWAHIQGVFNESYPGKWAVQVHPPIERLIDETSRYWLWVFIHGDPPGNMRIDPH